MKHKFLSVGFIISCFLLSSCGGTPVNNDDNNKPQNPSIGNIIVGDVRVQILDENTFRFEEKYKGGFEDENTFFIPNRDDYKGAVFTEEDKDGYHVIDLGDTEIYVPSAGTLEGIYITYKQTKIYEYKDIANSGELPSPRATPNAFAIADSPRILIPDGGYTYRSDADELSNYVIEDDVRDVYVVTPLKDGRKLRKLYTNLTGKAEMVRLQTLGVWDSKYYAYSDKTALEEIAQYDKYDLPLDNMVIDTDWRRSYGADGIGYDVNTDLFPDMEGFLADCEELGIDIMFNDHPEPAEGSSSLLDPIDVKYREDNLTKYLKMGLDYWWYDRNWSVALDTPISSINPETWGMYLFHDVTEHAFQELAGSDQIYRRPIIMANADDIYHGAYRDIKNTASHRYSMTWTGDIYSPAYSLAQEVANMIKGGINDIAYLNSDLGGHQGNPSNELYTRWIQYGALTPIFRPHSSKYNQRYRQPWLYGDEALNISREYMKMRYRLLGLFYQLAYENWDTGLPLVRSLEFNWADDKNAARYDEWTLGDNILFAPITDDIYNSIPVDWIDGTVKATYYNNTSLDGEPAATMEYNTFDFQWGSSSPIAGVNADNFSGKFEAKITPTQDTSFALTVDDGVRVYIDDELVLDKWMANDSVTYEIGDLKANKSYNIRVEYYEGSGNAYLTLNYKNTSGLDTKSFYLPEGEWLNVFSGEVYEGKKSYTEKFTLEESPIFVKLGSVTPLLDYQDNTSKFDWSQITYDVYPSKTGSSSSYLYEDDTETTAYKYGQNRKTPYESYFDEEEGCFVVKVGKSEGEFDGGDAFSKREMNFRIHQVGDFTNIKKVTVNDSLVSANIIQKDNGFPFSTEGGSRDSDVLSVDVSSGLDQENIIKIYIK